VSCRPVKEIENPFGDVPFSGQFVKFWIIPIQ
jgi:hypothetical protein